jgi:hypothetical protein
MTQQSSPPTFQRGDIWLVDFGNPVGHEQAFQRPALIISTRGLGNTAHIHGLLIVVPGPKEPQLLANGQIQTAVVKAIPTAHNGLAHNTYFMAVNGA